MYRSLQFCADVSFILHRKQFYSYSSGQAPHAPGEEILIDVAAFRLMAKLEENSS